MIIAVPKDISAAVILLGLAIIPIVTGMPTAVIEANPVFVRGAWVGAVVVLLVNGYILTAIILIALGLVIRFGVITYSHDSILAEYAAEQRRDPRFNKSTEIDLQIANGTIVRDPARWLDRGRQRGPLLLFPPTPEQLKMIGGSSS